MRIAGEDIWLPARVPGSIYQDLTDGGRLDDPYWRDNEKKALAIIVTYQNRCQKESFGETKRIEPGNAGKPRNIKGFRGILIL